jgi:hypothetical protein
LLALRCPGHNHKRKTQKKNTKEKHKRKTQKKKRPGCSLPAGSFLFGAYRIIRRTPTGTASTAATTPSIANPASGCW